MMHSVCLTTILGLLAAEPRTIQLPGLTEPVEVWSDRHGIPHVEAKNWADAARVAGYLHATDRLWQMDLFRRLASGRLCEILGEDKWESDVLMRQLGIRRSCEAILASGKIPADLLAVIQNYTAGVNIKMEQLGDAGLPFLFKAAGYKPEPWTDVDTIVFSKYMAWDQAGTFDDLWLAEMVDKLGAQNVAELWPTDRPYEASIVGTQTDRPRTASLPPVDPDWIAEHAAAFRETRAQLARTGEMFGPKLAFGSNNWAVDGSKSASGKPILASDPHLGFNLPSIWYLIHFSVDGENVAGGTMPGAPLVLIGHNDHCGWGITNMQADAVDFYVETVDPNDPTRYRHRGEWKPLERRDEPVGVRGESEPRTLVIESTVHGPVVRKEDKAITLCWVGLQPTTELIGFWKINRAKNYEDFLEGVDLIEAPAINLVYADRHGTIAMHPVGTLPVRLPGAGRLPMDGASGDHDWQGMIPRELMPREVNPARHFVASANNRPTPLGYGFYVGWMWDPSYRIRRIHDLLEKAEGLTLESMGKLQYDAYDLAAERFLPTLIGDVRGDNELTSEERAALDLLAEWNYVADPDSRGTILWLRWLDAYRAAVWDDEWTSRGITQPKGSWGFTGTNRREPEMEVLEFLTREQPWSPWFDDRTTPEVETRTNIARRSFRRAVAVVRKQFGDDPAKWAWRNINILSIRSMAEQDMLDRKGGPIPGDAWTVNPSSNGGPAGGGASMRLLVDFNQPSASLASYPGGQSENPIHRNYADLMPIWAKGEYVPLYPQGRDQLPAGTIATTLRFLP